MTRRIITLLCLGCALSTAAAGCATTSGERKHGLGVGQWEARLPTTASPIHELAYGRGGDAVGWNDDSLADLGNIDTLLSPEPAAQPQPKVKLAKHVAAPKRLAAANDVAVKVVAEPAPAEQIATASTPPEAAAPVMLAQNDARDRYAGREQQAKQQQQFRGGDAVIVVSAGALLVILLIVILILLLR